MTTLCIIGISGYGRVHYDMAQEAQASGAAQIVGATVINPVDEAERCAALRAIGCRIFDDYREMLRELSGEAELCMIPTGTPLHREMTVAALEAGMHVLVEKPAAGCMEDVEAMQAAAAQAERRVAVGYQHMYTEACHAAKRHILDGSIGELVSIRGLAMWPRSHSYYTRNRWAGCLAVDGVAVNDSPFNNAVAHDLMMMLFQAGATAGTAATPVSVEAELFRANAIESVDTASLHIETAEGVPIRFYTTHACREIVNPEIHIRGTSGSIVMTHAGAVLRPDGAPEMRYATDGGGGARDAMMSSVLDAVRGGGSFICDLSIASQQTAVVSAAHREAVIHPVAGESMHLPNGDPGTCIPGVEAALREAFDCEASLQSTGAAWAGRAGSVGC